MYYYYNKLLFVLLLFNKYSCQHFNNITINIVQNGRDIELIYAEEIYPYNDITHISIEGEDVPLLNQTSLQLEGLKYIKIVNCGLKEIQPGIFHYQPSRLRVINLNFNSLADVKKGVFDNLDVSAIYLSGNAIESIEDKSFARDRYLEILDLSRNKLKTLPANMLEGSTNLRQLILSHNRLKYLPNNLFHQAFSNVQRGQASKIDLSHNEFDYLRSSTFHGVKNIEELLLNNNNIEQLGPNIFNHFHYIGYLDLQDNLLKSFNNDILNKLKHTNDINLYYNPWSCNFVTTYINWSKKHNKTYTFDDITSSQCNLTQNII